MRARWSFLLAAVIASSCQRRGAPSKRDGELAHADPSASAVPAPVPLGDVAYIIGAVWGACARTSTGRVWCFSSPAWRGRVIGALHDVEDLVSAWGSFGPDFDNRCYYCALCARSAKGTVTCASNVRSADLVVTCGPPSKQSGAADLAACEQPFDDLHVDHVRAIGVQHTAEYRTPFCDRDAEGYAVRAFDVGLLLARDKDALVIPFGRAPHSSCCQSLESLLGKDCTPNGPLSGCSATYADAPDSWIDGLAHMADGTVRRLPARPIDEISTLRNAVRIAHGEALACFIDTAGSVHCMNEPYDGGCPYEPRPSYRDWHVVKGLEGATDLAILNGPYPAVCVLRGGAPWCWGLDGDERNPPRHVLGKTATEQCVIAYGEGPEANHCARKPKRVHDIADAVQIVAVSNPEGFCVRRTGGKISCWGTATNGALQDVTPP